MLSIQRFEYTFELFWKTIRSYLKEREGIISNSPKSCFRELFKIGILNENETEKMLEMTDMRNLTSHTYIEKVAQDIYNRVNNEYYKLIIKIMKRIKKRIT